MNATDTDQSILASTGIAGLDEILGGGLARGHLYLVQGQAGTGKTTLALHFLLAGARQGENVLYFTLAETAQELQQAAASHGWTLESSWIHELNLTSLTQAELQQTIFPASEIELDEMFQVILDLLQSRRPQRVVFDPITEIRLLAASPLRYRRQFLLLRQHLLRLGCTTFLLSDNTTEAIEQPPVSLVQGVIALMRTVPDYGPVHRTLEVKKLRAVAYADGYHSFRIHTGGLEVYPRLQINESVEQSSWDAISSGVSALDALVGGGLETGAACLIAGQSGTGKSSVATLYVHAAVRRGEAAAVFLFDERSEIWHHRAASFGMDMRSAEAQGLLQVRHIHTGEISPGEFAYHIRQLVEKDGVKVLVVDSLSGYLNAMAEERLVIHQMHELLTYLGRHGVLTLLVVTQHGSLGMHTHDPLDLSYLADTVLLTRHFEAQGAVRQAVSVLKKRYAPHERTIRELEIDAQGIRVGAPLTGFRGVLSGNPVYEDSLSVLERAAQRREHPPPASTQAKESGDVPH